jgi:F0F1-type ATP synthase delta subunit
MTKKLVKQLVEASYINNALHKQTVEKIASYLSRRELKEYIRALRATERTRNVYVSTATQLAQHEAALQAMFPGKKITFTTDSDLLAGIRVVYNDTVYEMSLKQTLKQLEEHINE